MSIAEGVLFIYIIIIIIEKNNSIWGKKFAINHNSLKLLLKSALSALYSLYLEERQGKVGGWPISFNTRPEIFWVVGFSVLSGTAWDIVFKRQEAHVFLQGFFL